MTSSILTPFDTGRVVELGRKTFRKQILPVGSINYKGRRINFTREYLAEVEKAYKAKAFDMVPAQMADAQNTHTDDPFRLRGEIKGVEVTDDGLYGYVELDDDAAKLVTEHPNVGVSARIVEDYTRADGKHFPKAMGQVLLTLDPRLPGMNPWEAVELSQDTGNAIDLSMEEWNMPKIKASEIEGLGDAITEAVKAAISQGQDPQATEADDQDQDEAVEDLDIDALTQALTDEFDGDADAAAAAINEILGDSDDESDSEEEGELVAASNDDRDQAIELARAEAHQAREQVAQFQTQLAQERFASRRRQLLEAGVTPAAIELARPFLATHAPHTVELSNGSSADATKAFGDLLELIASGRASVDMSAERGHSFVGDGDDDAREVAAMNEQFDEQFGR